MSSFFDPEIPVFNIVLLKNLIVGLKHTDVCHEKSGHNPMVLIIKIKTTRYFPNSARSSLRILFLKGLFMLKILLTIPVPRL